MVAANRCLSARLSGDGARLHLFPVQFHRGHLVRGKGRGIHAVPRRLAAALHPPGAAHCNRSEALRPADAAVASLSDVHRLRPGITGAERRPRRLVDQVRDVSVDHDVLGVGRDQLPGRSSRRCAVPDRDRGADRSRPAVSGDRLAMGLRPAASADGARNPGLCRRVRSQEPRGRILRSHGADLLRAHAGRTAPASSAGRCC
ncbi:hypothetical protein ACVJF2_000270 [Bradyrhizobium sp. USDA 4519]